MVFVQFILLQGALEHRCYNVWPFHPAAYVVKINQLLPVPHIGIQRMEFFRGLYHILAIRHLVKHTLQCCIWQLREVNSRWFASALTQIRHSPLVASLSLFLRLLTFACTFLQTHLNPRPPDPLNIIELIERQPVLECH